MISYEELYEKYATDVLRVSYFYLGDRHKAEDVCQDVFVKLITNAPDLQEGREKAWLLKVALNRCRDLWRGAWLKRVVLGSPVFELVPAPDEYSQLADQQRSKYRQYGADTASHCHKYQVLPDFLVKSHYFSCKMFTYNYTKYILP